MEENKITNEDLFKAVKELGNLCTYTLGMLQSFSTIMLEENDIPENKLYYNAHKFTNEACSEINDRIKVYNDAIRAIERK